MDELGLGDGEFVELGYAREGGCGVGATTSESRTKGDGFVELHIDPAHIVELLEEHPRTHHEVALGRAVHLETLDVEGTSARGVGLNGEGVGHGLDGEHQGVDVVEAVVALAENVESEVYFRVGFDCHFLHSWG